MNSYSTNVKKAQGKKRKPKIETWLRKRISSLDIGMMWEKGDERHPIHLNSNKDILAIFNNGQHWRRDRLTNEMLEAHFAGKETLYFASTGDPKVDDVLVMIDIDCHHCGSLKGAKAFARHLAKHYFPAMYWEPSTNGEGVHGYILVHKSLTGDIALKATLARLDRFLKQILAAGTWDVELVEVKGLPPVLSWDRHQRGKLANYTSGVLAKLPRNRDRFDELRNTTLLTLGDIRRLPVDAKRIADKIIKRHSAPAGSSTASLSFSEQEIAAVKGHYLEVAQSLMTEHKLKTSGRWVAEDRDVAIFLMLFNKFSLNPYPNGAMPTQRFIGYWTDLHEQGDVDRPFNEKRFKAIRDYLSSLGLIDWEDPNYEKGWYDHDGNYHKGKAAKWHASDKLLETLEIPEEQDAEGEEREHPIDTPLILFAKNLTRQPESEAIRPVERVVIPIWRRDDLLEMAVPSLDYQIAA
jgi:hypothetical protein